MKKMYATGVIYDEDDHIREIFQHESEKNVRKLMKQVLEISDKNLTSQYVGRIRNPNWSTEHKGKKYIFEKGEFVRIENIT